MHTQSDKTGNKMVDPSTQLLHIVARCAENGDIPLHGSQHERRPLKLCNHWRFANGGGTIHKSGKREFGRAVLGSCGKMSTCRVDLDIRVGSVRVPYGWNTYAHSANWAMYKFKRLRTEESEKLFLRVKSR